MCACVCVALLTAPQNQNVSLGDAARFSCGGTGILLSWFIDQLTLNENIISDRGISHSELTVDGAVFSNISLPANVPNNNSEVYCVVYATSTINRQSMTAVMRVQGTRFMLCASLPIEDVRLEDQVSLLGRLCRSALQYKLAIIKGLQFNSTIVKNSSKHPQHPIEGGMDSID